MHEQLIPRFPQFQVLHRLLDEILPFHRIDIEHGSVKLQDRRGLVTPEASGLLKSDSHNLTNLRPISYNVNSHHFRSSRGWLQNGAQGHEKSSFSRPVRAQNYHYLAFVNCKVQASKSI